MREQTTIPKREAAVRLQVSTRTLERWARAGIGPKPIKRGPRRVFYDLAEVESFRLCGHVGRSA